MTSMFEYNPISVREAILLLATLQPIARQLQSQAAGSELSLDEQTQVLVRYTIERIELADFSSPALRKIYQAAGLSAEEMQALKSWYSRWYATQPPRSPACQIDKELFDY